MSSQIEFTPLSNMLLIILTENTDNMLLSLFHLNLGVINHKDNSVKIPNKFIEGVF